MQSIQFLGGASGEVTGSSYLLTGSGGTRVLIDFGMFQGTEDVVTWNYYSLPFKPSEVSAVILTHAHLDHCGRLPLLIFGGFKGKIYMTKPTVSLIDIILSDSAKVAESNLKFEPLYSMDEVDKVFRMVEAVEYEQKLSLKEFEIVFRDAGHILGSASIEITDTSSREKIVFSGDLGNTPEDLVRPTESISDADYVVMESTYGDSDHPVEDVSAILQDEINTIEERDGVLLIPAFSLERTQEILHRLHHLKKDGKIRSDTPVFLDSPMGIRATLIYKAFKTYYNEEIQGHSDDPFAFEGLVVTEESRDSKEIVKALTPKVIIAGSGMMSGGRIMHHAFTYLPFASTRLLFVGYQAEETLGRQILLGSKNVRIFDKMVKVKASIREIKTLSSHADQTKLLHWLRQIKGVKKVFLIHGEEAQREALQEKIQKELRIENVYVPKIEDVHTFSG
jgi:metallo-beta-lactamase family protein